MACPSSTATLFPSILHEHRILAYQEKFTSLKCSCSQPHAFSKLLFIFYMYILLSFLLEYFQLLIKINALYLSRFIHTLFTFTRKWLLHNVFQLEKIY